MISAVSKLISKCFCVGWLWAAVGGCGWWRAWEMRREKPPCAIASERHCFNGHCGHHFCSFHSCGLHEECSSWWSLRWSWMLLCWWLASTRPRFLLLLGRPCFSKSQKRFQWDWKKGMQEEGTSSWMGRHLGTTLSRLLSGEKGTLSKTIVPLLIPFFCSSSSASTMNRRHCSVLPGHGRTLMTIVFSSGSPFGIPISAIVLMFRLLIVGAVTVAGLFQGE